MKWRKATPKVQILEVAQENRFLDYQLETTYNLLDEFLRDESQKVLSLYLKRYFKQHKKYGKRDRKRIQDIIYAQIRRQLWGWQNWDPKEYYLSEQNGDLDLREIRNHQSKFISKLRSERLSSAMNEAEIVERYYRPSRSYFFLAPAEKNISDEKIHRVEGANYVDAGTNIASLLGHDKYAVQDISSQKIWDYIGEEILSLWDVCAGSGGKSLRCKTQYRDAEQICSDLRKRSLYNLLERYQKMELEVPKVFQCDMRTTRSKLPVTKPSHILCDVPCTGSAVWHRNPEAALLWDSSRIEYYQNLQRQIVKNARPYMAEDTKLVYVTCSYFQKENEENVRYFEEELQLRCEKQKMLNYYSSSGDALYVAVLAHV